MSRFIMPAGCILDITEVMSLVLDYWIGEFGSPNSKGVSNGVCLGALRGEHSLKVARSARAHNYDYDSRYDSQPVRLCLSISKLVSIFSWLVREPVNRLGCYSYYSLASLVLK